MSGRIGARSAGSIGPLVAAVLGIVLDYTKMVMGTPSRQVGSSPAPSVLVVDDNFDVREGLCDFLVSQGYLVETATDGLDALNHLKQSLPDVVLLDLRMPRMDGYEFLARRQVDASLSRVPVIVVSASTDDRRIDAPVTATLSKPVNPQQLLDVLSRELARRAPGRLGAS